MKYYKTIVEIEILSDESTVDEIAGADLLQLHEMITDGQHSGKFQVVAQKQLTEKQMARALLAQGSDPDFLIQKEI